MSTTSTVVAFRAGLLEGLRDHATITADGVQVEAAWPGPDTEDEGIFLGGVSGVSEIASIKAGRQRRNETYRQEVIVQVWRAADTPSASELSVARIFDLFAAIEDVLADDPETGGVQWGEVAEFELVPVTFESGWAHRLTVVVTATARLN